MFDRQLNRIQIDLSIEPRGPILIRRGRAGADPTRPNLEWVRTSIDGKKTVYLPGSSLKGVLRSQAERLLLSEGIAITATFDEAARQAMNSKTPGDEAYRDTCPLGRTFGSLHLKGRFAISDCIPGGAEEPGSAEREAQWERANAVEERNGVAIDRLLGSALGGALFDQEVVVGGRFDGRIHLRNVQLYQLALVLFLIRDLDEGYAQIGSSTTRGYGWVSARVRKLSIESRHGLSGSNKLLGLAALHAAMGDEERIPRYRLFSGDEVEVPSGLAQVPTPTGLFDRLDVKAESLQALELSLVRGPWLRFLEEARVGQEWVA